LVLLSTHDGTGLRPHPLPPGRELQAEALQRAQELRPVFNELASLSHRGLAKELNARGIKTAQGAEWNRGGRNSYPARLRLTRATSSRRAHPDGVLGPWLSPTPRTARRGTAIVPEVLQTRPFQLLKAFAATRMRLLNS